MELSKLKNIVILVLILINVFFLTIFITGRIVEINQQKKMVENIRTVMAKNNISFNVKKLPSEIDFNQEKTGRKTAKEKQIASVVLGDTEMTDQGGNIHMFSGASGIAVFRSGGEFEIDTDGKAMEKGGSEDGFAASLLKSMDIETENPVLSGDGRQVTAVCVCDKKKIFNCRIVFNFENGSLIKISGKYAAGVWDAGTGGTASTAASALMTFLNYKTGEKCNCKEINGIESGYYLMSSAIDEGILSPVWYIGTDSGAYCVDASSGVVQECSD